MPRDFREYIATLLSEPDPEAQAFIRNPQPYPGQQGVPSQALTPPDWAVSLARRRQPNPHGGRLPRLSEIGPLLRAPTGPRSYQPPRQVIGPGGLTGEAPALRASVSELALPSFLPNPVAPPQGGPEAPLSPFRFQPGTGQPAAPPQQGGEDDLDAAFNAALARVRAVTAAQRTAPRKQSR